MASRRLSRRPAAFWAVIVIIAAAALALFLTNVGDAFAECQAASKEWAPDAASRARLQVIVRGILAAWDKADVVCLGEDHGRKNDSDLRIALVEHPDFVRTVNVVIVEFANPIHQAILDRLALDGEDFSRRELRVVWRDAEGATVWEAPIYEAFLRAVRRANLLVPRERRVRLLAGDTLKDWSRIHSGRDLLPLMNRGRSIREAISREILDKRLKGLAIYGAGHCECRGGGFPGELEDLYPGKIWAAFSFYGEEGRREGRRMFGLGREPKLIPISGTENAKLPAAKMFFTGRADEEAALGDIADAIVYYGDAEEIVVPAAEPIDQDFQRELDRRGRIVLEAVELLRKKRNGGRGLA